MPEFGNPFSGMKADRTLDTQEMLRALRFSMAAEFEAVQLYKQLAESIQDPLVQKVLEEIADEELVHAGEFMSLIKRTNPNEEKHYKEGEKEVKQLSKKEGIPWEKYRQAVRQPKMTQEIDRMAESFENVDPRISLALDRLADKIDKHYGV